MTEWRLLCCYGLQSTLTMKSIANKHKAGSMIRPFFCFAPSCPGLSRASTFLRQIGKEGVDGRDKPGHDVDSASTFLVRHCERSDLSAGALAKAEAIHSATKQEWISSPQVLLPMTPPYPASFFRG